MKSAFKLKFHLSLTSLVLAYSGLSFAQDVNAPAPSASTTPTPDAKTNTRALQPGQVQVKVTNVTPTVVPPQEGSNNPSMAYYVVTFEYSGQVFTTQLPYDPGEFLIIQSTPPSQINAQAQGIPPSPNADPQAGAAINTLPAVAGAVQPIYIVPPPDFYPYPYPYPFFVGGYFAAYPYRFGGGFYPGYYHGNWGHRAGFGGGGRGHGRR
jgi:hypothetical protein